MSAILRVDGSVNFWTLAMQSVRSTIEAGLRRVDGQFPDLGINFEALTPKPRTNSAALKSALQVKCPKHEIQALKGRDGFAVLEVTRLDDDVTMNTKRVVKVDADGTIDIARGHDFSFYYEIREEYDRQKNLLTPAQVSASLVCILTRLHGIPLRPTGGIYWLPESSHAVWNAIASAYEGASANGAGRNALYRITHQFDAQAIRAVRDALLDEVRKESDRLVAEVDSGELGEVALESRATEAERLQKLVHEYESILGERLQEAGEIAKSAELAATAAKIMASAAV